MVMMVIVVPLVGFEVTVNIWQGSYIAALPILNGLRGIVFLIAHLAVGVLYFWSARKTLNIFGDTIMNLQGSASETKLRQQRQGHRHVRLFGCCSSIYTYSDWAVGNPIFVFHSFRTFAYQSALFSSGTLFKRRSFPW